MTPYQGIINEFDEIRKKLSAGEIEVHEAEALHNNLGKRLNYIRTKLEYTNVKRKDKTYPKVKELE